MIEARTFVESLERPREILKELNADFKGEYKIHNMIYASKDPEKKLTDIFLRLRTIPLNIWNEKSVIVAIKETKQEKVGKNSVIPLKKQFDTKEEALKFIEENYSDQFAYSFEFGCRGWQYDLGDDQVDLEDIEGHSSVEFKSKTVEGIQRLLNIFGITEIIQGPSVVAVKELLKK